MIYKKVLDVLKWKKRSWNFENLRTWPGQAGMAGGSPGEMTGLSNCTFYRTQVFIGPKCLSDPSVYRTQVFTGPKFLSDPNFYRTQVFMRPKFLSEPRFYRTQVFIGPSFLLDLFPSLPYHWLTHSCYWDLTDGTLADEDGYSVLVSDLGNDGKSSSDSLSLVKIWSRFWGRNE